MDMASRCSHDRYLDSEERFEIFTVKAAERPHLLHWTPSTLPEESRECHSDPDEDVSPPLTDGCDLPGWRCEGIAPCMNDDLCNVNTSDGPFQGTLNVGAGSTFFRRESLFPFICSSGMTIPNEEHCTERCWWHSAKRRLSIPPPFDRAAPVVEYNDAIAMVDYVQDSQHDNVVRKITRFTFDYEITNRPVKIMNATEGWDAMPKYKACNDVEQQTTMHGWMDILPNNDEEHSTLGWTFANLQSRFGNVMFRFSDQHGEMLSLNTYAKYIINPEGLSDDSPLGIYDSEFGDDDVTRVLLHEYSVPQCFSQDIFELAEDKDEGNDPMHHSRPPYRWILIGPERSGTGMHVDPLWTNAWVTVLQGRKRWLLFPPQTPVELIGMHPDKPQIPSSIWFRDYYDRVTSSSWQDSYQPVEVLQDPGETVFVPAGWPHIVLNLELTVAVTHNYASEFGPLEQMMEEVLREEPEFAARWIVGWKKRGKVMEVKEWTQCREK